MSLANHSKGVPTPKITWPCRYFGNPQQLTLRNSRGQLLNECAPLQDAGPTSDAPCANCAGWATRENHHVYLELNICDYLAKSPKSFKTVVVYINPTKVMTGDKLYWFSPSFHVKPKI